MTRIFLVLFLFCRVSYGQGLDSLSILIKSIQKGANDSIRFAANEQFITTFRKILSEENSFDRNFDTLKNVSVQSPADYKFRIYTWVVPHYDGGRYDYYGFIQVKTSGSASSKNTSAFSLIELNDSTTVIRKPESEKLSPNRWLGAVYYNIQTVKKSGTEYYTLLGWKGKDQKTTQKVIEVLYFNKGKLQFGYPLFKTGSVFKNRMLFSFTAQSSMLLHYDEKFGGIVYDHLTGDKKNPDVISGSVGTYDAFKWKKGKWLQYTDVDVRTRWEPNQSLPEPPDSGRKQ